VKQYILERKIMWGDLDALGIVFYPRYYEWIDGCAHLFFASLGLSLGDLACDKKMIFGLVETSCRYFQPGRYHQDIRIITAISEIGDKTVTLTHNITLAADGQALAEGREKRICLDISRPDELRAVPIPPEIRRVLEQAYLP